jgi:hypothetical protein
MHQQVNDESAKALHVIRREPQNAVGERETTGWRGGLLDVHERQRMLMSTA